MQSDSNGHMRFALIGVFNAVGVSASSKVTSNARPRMDTFQSYYTSIIRHGPTGLILFYAARES